ncbi:MAG: fructokinase [Thermoleophilaceae bacterium]|nr:fructokinase [Thermoleophilaceae bacterium]
MIAVAGEALIDLVERDGTLHPLPGGGPFNTAVALGRLDVPTGFLGRLSDDQFGELLVGLLRESGVDDRYVLRGSAPTPVAVVHMSGDGDAAYSFHLAGTAYADLTSKDLPELGPEVLALHLGTLALATDPPASALEGLMQRESERRLIMVDPNIRPDVIGDRDAYLARFETWLTWAHVLKLSARDAEWLYPDLGPEECARRLLSLGARLAVVTLGPEGALAVSDAGEARVASPPIEVVDTVGAGDAFGAGLLRHLWENAALDLETVGLLDDAALEAALHFACAVAALQCSREGAVPPSLESVLDFLAFRS